jgi:type II secretion system protein J
MSPAPHTASGHGFTLIELLLSLTIFAVVLAAVNGVFFGAMQLRNRTTATIEAALPAEQAMAVLRRDLRGIVAPGSSTNAIMSGSFRTGVSTMGVQQDSGFEFYSNSATLDDVYPWSEMQKISYILRNPTNRLAGPGRTLVRLASRNLLTVQQDIPEERPILEGVTQLDFSFYDGTQWRTTWDSTTEASILPRAIRCQITLSPPVDPATGFVPARATLAPLQLVIPITTWANTNALQSGTGGGQ